MLQATKETSQVVYNILQEFCLGQISCKENESRAQKTVGDFFSVFVWELNTV